TSATQFGVPAIARVPSALKHRELMPSTYSTFMRLLSPFDSYGFAQFSGLAFFQSSTCLSFKSFSRNFAYSTCCTSVFPSIANAAAVAADWPSTMNTGSIRIEPYAICEAERHTGTNRLVHSLFFGTMLRYAMGYGEKPPTWTSPSLRTLPSFVT